MRTLICTPVLSGSIFCKKRISSFSVEGEIDPRKRPVVPTTYPVEDLQPLSAATFDFSLESLLPVFLPFLVSTGGSASSVLPMKCS